MKLIIVIYAIVSIATSLPAKDVQQNPEKVENIQAKRDLSLSYAATDIGSKEGTRVKTITVIKNVVGKKEKPLKIDPKLHKDEDWGSHFRDNFDAYGAIPNVPDIDELFDFVNKKGDKEQKEHKETKPSVEKTESTDKESSEKKREEDSSGETTVFPAPVEETVNEDKVEKIAGDAELIQDENKKDTSKSQSLHLGKYLVKEHIKEDYHPIKSHASMNTHKNDKYVQSSSAPYYYSQPNLSYPANVNSFTGNIPQSQKGRGSISVSTPSGKKFDVPINNVTDTSPYIAPSHRRTQNFPGGLQFVTSSQRPYIAPNLRKSYEVQPNNFNSSNCATGVNTSTNNAQPTVTLNFQEIQPNIRPIRVGVNKPNSPRSRGLRY